MSHEYRIVEGYGPYMNKRWELQRYRMCDIDSNGEVNYQWQMECCGTKEFCEEALQKRLDRISEGLEPTLYEQRRKERKAMAVGDELRKGNDAVRCLSSCRR